MKLCCVVNPYIWIHEYDKNGHWTVGQNPSSLFCKDCYEGWKKETNVIL